MRSAKETFYGRLKRFSQLLKEGDPLRLPDGNMWEYVQAAEVLAGLADTHLPYLIQDGMGRIIVKLARDIIVRRFLRAMMTPSLN